MDKKEAIKIILECAKLYNKNLSNKNIMFVCRNKKQQLFAFEVLFLPRNFLHLTGVKITNKDINSSIKFYRACLNNKLSISDFKYSEDGTTIIKLRILKQVMNLHKVSKMFGEYNHTKPYLFTEKATGNVVACIGFIDESGFYVPNTALKEDIRDITTEDSRSTIIYTFVKNVEEKLYSNLTYIANSYNLEKLLQNQKILTKIDLADIKVEANNCILNDFIRELKEKLKNTDA